MKTLLHTVGTVTLCLGALVGCGSGPDVDGAPLGSTTSELQSAEESALLAFVNDAARATETVLDVDCALRSDAARNIVTARDGGPGTDDDRPFADVNALDAVPRVGAKTIEALTTCAADFGYLPSAEELALLQFLNDDATTFARLDDTCALRADAAANLVAHRDGDDGMWGTGDDDPFHSEAEVDVVPRVGPATIAQLQACAAQFGFGAQPAPEPEPEPEPSWSPLPVAYDVSASDPNVTVETQPDGTLIIHHATAAPGATLVVGFDAHTLSFDRGPKAFGTYTLPREVPEGYGAAYFGYANGSESFRITRDPAGTLSSGQALQVAREGLVTYLRDVRMQQPGWEDAMGFSTWAEAVSMGVMGDIAGFGDGTHDGMVRAPESYAFFGTGPFGLYTEVRVSKATGQPAHFIIEID